MKKVFKLATYAGIGGRTGKLSSKLEAFSKKAVYVLIALCMTVGFSCKDDDDDGGDSGNSTYFHHSGHSYLIVKELKTWSAAFVDAKAKGGYLVEINSQEEQNAVYAAIQASGISTTYKAVPDGGGAAYIWIGASDEATEGKWIWAYSNTEFWNNGAPVENRYHNWGGKKSGTVNEPDDYDGQDAAAIGLAKWPTVQGIELGVAGEWNDIDESNTLYYIVEFDEEKN
ncbi:MAG: hypothetical protein LBM08_13035 [Dysgonamonadaceae bacterium]|jgi:hypothetical protein|nr:hypothetical protein [Dysgonamonadaceae bacterium]